MTARSTRLEGRDLEILRTLARVRYLTTRQIASAFFSCPRIARRRVHRLSEYDLVRPHAKGMPEILRYTAWRLTARGVAAVTHAFPDEPLPDGLVDRVANGSLHHALHREALADLYLGLVVPDREKLAEADLGAHRRWVAELRANGDAITWQPDGDVVLAADSLGERVEVVPDAVLRAPHGRRRIFIELDRSTKNLGRVREGLGRYRTILAESDLGGDSASVLFVVRSAARRANLEALGSFLAERLGLVVLCEAEAVEWLRVEVLGVEAQPPRAKRLHAAATRAYVWMHKLGSLLEAHGMHDALLASEPAFMTEGRERLVALFHAINNEGDAR